MENKVASIDNYVHLLTFQKRRLLKRVNLDIALSAVILLKTLNVAGASTPFTSKDIEIQLSESKILPDVVDKAPVQQLFVEYGKYRVNFGTHLTPLAVEFPPSDIKWSPTQDKYYTLVLTDPDFPSPESPNRQEWQHWLVGNIPSPTIQGGEPVPGNISEGQTLTEYFGIVSFHRFGTPHRYVFLLYEHDHRIIFDEPYIRHVVDDFYRGDFSAREFAKKYNLQEPIAINYFRNTKDPRKIKDSKIRRDSDKEENI